VRCQHLVAQQKNTGSKTLLLDHLKTAEGLGGPLTDFCSCLTKVTHCDIVAKDENKEASTVPNLFHKNVWHFCTTLIYFLLILFHIFL
jgi:hypothetical protein